MLIYNYFKVVGVFIFFIFSFLFINVDRVDARESLNKQFLEAAKTGKLSEVESLLKQGVDINIVDSGYNFTALMWASQNGHEDIVNYLIKLGADIEVTSIWGTALTEVSRNGNLEIVRILIENGADVNAKSEYVGRTALMEASANNHLSIVRFLVENGADINAITDERMDINIEDKGYTALMFASQNGHEKIIRLLVRSGADINAKDNDSYGYTALINASIEKDDFDTVQLLLELGADINIKDNFGFTALMHASKNKNYKTLKFLIDNGATKNITEIDHKLLYYVKRGNIEGVKRCIDQGADINLMGGYLMGQHFEAPLTITTFQNGSIEILKYLVDKGIYLELTDENNDETVLQIASNNGNLEVVKYLVEAGANTKFMTIVDWASAGWLDKVQNSIKLGVNINIDNGAGTALMNASRNGHLEVVKYLVESGADTKDMTLLNWSSAGYLDKVKSLVKSGADINQKDEHKLTPLIVASNNGHLNVVRYLVGAGADITVKNGQGNRSLNDAIKRDHIDVVKYLINEGVDINAEVYSERALNIASWNGRLDIVRLLLKSGADINVSDGFNNTALMSVSLSGLNQNIDIIRLLVKSGADINIIIDKVHGGTALRYAVLEGHFEIVSVLIELGADINIKDNDGKTVIELAKERGNIDIIKLLNNKSFKK